MRQARPPLTTARGRPCSGTERCGQTSSTIVLGPTPEFEVACKHRGWGEAEQSQCLRAEFDLDLRGETDAIFRQVLVNLLLFVELRGVWIEIHVDPGTELGSLPFLFNHGLLFVCATDSIGLASLRHL